MSQTRCCMMSGAICPAQRHRLTVCSSSVRQNPQDRSSLPRRHSKEVSRGL